MGQGPSGSTRHGFQGTIGSLPLVDLLQVWSMNAFSGLVAVSSHARSGHIYFVDGEIVHAEMEGLTGEAAVRTIVGWPEGAFELHPNTTTMHRTIEKRLSHLLLDAHRELDEQRRDTPAPEAEAAAPATPRARAAAAAPPAREPARSGVLDQLRAIRGVTALVRFGPDGRPAGESGPAAEALAARGLYLALTHAAVVAEAFGLHELSVGAVGGGPDSFVLVQSAGQFLCLAVAPDVAIEPVVAQVRALLTRPSPRPQ